MRMKRRFAQPLSYVHIGQKREFFGQKPRKIAWMLGFAAQVPAIAQFLCHRPVHELHSIDE
jgi:hypothetical protein